MRLFSVLHSGSPLDTHAHAALHAQGEAEMTPVISRWRGPVMRPIGRPNLEGMKDGAEMAELGG